MILEAVVPAIRIFPLSKLAPFYWISTNTILDEEAALSRVGEPYSKWEAVRGFFGKTKKDGSWQCAEFVRDILGMDGVSTPSAVVFDAINLNDGKILRVTK